MCSPVQMQQPCAMGNRLIRFIKWSRRFRFKQIKRVSLGAGFFRATEFSGASAVEMGYSDASCSAPMWGFHETSSGFLDPSYSVFRLDFPVVKEGIRSQKSIGNFTMNQLRIEPFPSLEVLKKSLTSDLHSPISSVNCNPSYDQKDGSSVHSLLKLASLHGSSIAAENESEEKVNCIEDNTEMDFQMICSSRFNCITKDNESQKSRNQYSELNSTSGLDEFSNSKRYLLPLLQCNATTEMHIPVSLKGSSEATLTDGASAAEMSHKICMFNRCRKRPRGDSDLCIHCIAHRSRRRWSKRECNISIGCGGGPWYPSLGNCHPDRCADGAIPGADLCTESTVHGESMFGGVARSALDGVSPYRYSAGETCPQEDYFIAVKGRINGYDAENNDRLVNDSNIDLGKTQGASNHFCSQDSSMHSAIELTDSCHEPLKGVMGLPVVHSALAEDQRVHGSLIFNGMRHVKCKLSAESMYEDQIVTSRYPVDQCPNDVIDEKFSSELSRYGKNDIEKHSCHRPKVPIFSSILAGVPSQSLQPDTYLKISELQQQISSGSILRPCISSWNIFGQSSAVRHLCCLGEDSTFSMSSLSLAEERVHGGNIMTFVSEASD